MSATSPWKHLEALIVQPLTRRGVYTLTSQRLHLHTHVQCTNTYRHSKCSVVGSVTTSSISWTQEYDVEVLYACGETGLERWKADLVTTSILTTSSQYSPSDWNNCTVIPLPPITDTCRYVCIPRSASGTNIPGQPRQPDFRQACIQHAALSSASHKPHATASSLPLLNRVCAHRSNPGCAYLGSSNPGRTCCPRTDGTYAPW
jgi:hypothetical protein